MIKVFNDTREKSKIEDQITVEPQYKSFSLDDNGNLTFTYKDKDKNKVINFGNINNRLISTSDIKGGLSCCSFADTKQRLSF